MKALLANKKVVKGSVAALTALATSALFVVAAYAAVHTDKSDYKPGSVVTISGDNGDGAGYVSGESVRVDVTGPNGYTASCNAVADDAGAWSCQVTLNSDESAYGDYSYTATGQTSGVTQTGAFTDGAPTPQSPIYWDGPGKGGTNDDGSCKSFLDDPDLNPGPGEQGWLFILTNADDSTSSSDLTTTFSPAAQSPSNPIAGVQKGGGSYHFIVYTTAGATLVSASATNGMTNSQLTVSHCELGTQPTAALHIRKFYDANANGIYDGVDVLINGWQVTYNSNVTSTPVDLDPIAPGTYVVSEGTPTQTNWFHTTATSFTVTLANGDDETVTFGNLCVGAGGGLTLGFWSNKNGQALVGNDDLAMLSGLNLVKGDGSAFDPTNYTQLRTWLLNATATNMAYMLSAQLAAMELNVYNGKVNGSALIYAPGTLSANSLGFASVSSVMAEANTELGTHPITGAYASWRSYQEALKNALDRANNNLNFVQSTPCAFSFAS